jgi:signal transduction histidine kinase
VAALADGVLAEERRMEGMVAALLTLARLEDQEPEQRLVDLDDVVVREVQRSREAGGPVIDMTAVGAGQVRGDEVLLTQAVRNLLSNAVRHARKRVTVALSEETSGVRLVVSDDGTGVPEGERTRIFGRFVRLDEARSRDEGGSGLGLAIVEKVVSAAHGSVVVDDGPDGGARFTVVLPSG